MRSIIFYILILLLFVVVIEFCAHAVDNEYKYIYNELPRTYSSQRRRRTHAHLPTFSKKDKENGKAVAAYMIRDEEYSRGKWKGKGKGHSYYNYYHHKGKSDKKSKKQDKSYKKDKKDPKKHYGYYGYYSVPKSVLRKTRKPTRKPTLSPLDTPWHTPAPVEVPSSSINNWDSQSEDIPSTTGNSEDFGQPVHRPAMIPPSPIIMTEKPTNLFSPTDGDENNESVELELNAIDYTLSQTDRTPIKADFLELQIVTASYFKDYMINAYQISTQATLSDFTTVFVTAHFTPGDPVHVQYNSTAFFSADSINVPTSETLSMVLSESLNDPQSYINELKAQLSEHNPFSSTTKVTFTDPQDTPVTRSAFTSQIRGIAGIASVAASSILTMFAAFFFCCRRNCSDDSSYNEVLNKKMNGDATISTLGSDTGHSSIHDNSFSVCSSRCSISNKEIKYSSKRASTKNKTQTRPKNNSSVGSRIEQRRNISTQKKKCKKTNILQAPNEIIPVYRRPRTVEEIEKLLTIVDGDII
mmetsp:Transcript_36400/g.39478  ORF Transcript_36400/g.39478 Transcript_36400/m.39478 type:complete len:526 (-) Transcript_36400:64-1641(-)